MDLYNTFFCLVDNKKHIGNMRAFYIVLLLLALPLTISSGRGSRVIDTTEAGADVRGFGGPVPLLIYVSGGRIDSVTMLPNRESPSFVRRAVRGGILERWNGMTVEEAREAHVDAVSGATFTSRAVIENVRRGLSR